MIKRVVAVGLVIVSSALALAGGPLDAAVEAFRQGDYAKTVELASAVKADDAARPRAAYLAGEAHLQLESWSDAAAAFKEVLAKKADSVPALTGLGRAQTGSGAAEEAVATLEKAVKLDAKDAVARRSLGEARIAKGDPEKGRADLDAATKLDPKDILASRSYVESLIAADKLDSAAKEADRLAKAAPDQAMGLFLKALVLDRDKKHKDAIDAYEKALAKDDQFLDAHKNLAILCVAQSNTYQDRERVKKAFDHFERYFALGGRDEKLREIYTTIKSVLAQYGFK
jgi:tetratricopeptide (TPR) repeat protein